MLPVASAVLLKQTQEKIDDFSWETDTGSTENALESKTDIPMKTSLAVKLFIANTVFGLVTGLFRSFIFTDENVGASDYLLLVTLSGVGLLVVTLVGNALVKQIDYKWLYRFSFFAVVSGLLLAAFIPGATIATSMLFMLGVACITTMLWSLLSDVANRNRKKTAPVFGFGLSGLFFGIFLGSIIAHLGIRFMDSGIAHVVSSVVSILSLMLVYLFILPDKAIELEEPSSNETGGKWRRKIDAIADERSLTPREKEVFALLAQGQSAKKIQETLHISISTANAHRYHIYDKLGVTSKQELINHVEKL
jgi:DNA-binding CsgD family transcriptional regulator